MKASIAGTNMPRFKKKREPDVKGPHAAIAPRLVKGVSPNGTRRRTAITHSRTCAMRVNAWRTANERCSRAQTPNAVTMRL